MQSTARNVLVSTQYIVTVINELLIYLSRNFAVLFRIRKLAVLAFLPRLFYPFLEIGSVQVRSVFSSSLAPLKQWTLVSLLSELRGAGAGSTYCHPPLPQKIQTQKKNQRKTRGARISGNPISCERENFNLPPPPSPSSLFLSTPLCADSESI